MRRLAVVVVIHWCGIMAFSQSPTHELGVHQASPRQPAIPSQQFDLNGRQTRQVTPSTPFWNMDFSSLASAQMQISAQDTGQQFHAPTINTGSLLAMLPPSPFPAAKLEPIPTQWPKARIEQIPTTWPALKMQPAESRLTILSK